MKKSVTVEAFAIHDIPGLDEITVFWQDTAQGQGHITIRCYGEAWTAWWGAMGVRTIKQFFSAADEDYLVNRLIGSQFQKRTKGHEQYLVRIIRAIKENL